MGAYHLKAAGFMKRGHKYRAQKNARRVEKWAKKNKREKENEKKKTQNCEIKIHGFQGRRNLIETF